jgi:hypothetical protein
MISRLHAILPLRNARPQTTILGAALLTLGLLVGPASAQQDSGFLADYSKLTPSADNPNTRLWINKDFDFKPYRKILLDPVEVWVSPTSEYKGSSPDVLKRMSDSFTNAAKRALEPGYQLVKKPGPGVLHLRLAITGVNLVKPGMKPRDILPVVFVLKAASGAGDARNVVLSGELQMLDPKDNVVAASVSTGTSDKAITQKRDITWADLESITNNWARELRKGLDDARGVAPKS